MANEVGIPKQLGAVVNAELYTAIMQEAKLKAVSKSAIIRWALKEQYDWRPHAMSGGVLASPYP